MIILNFLLNKCLLFSINLMLNQGIWPAVSLGPLGIGWIFKRFVSIILYIYICVHFCLNFLYSVLIIISHVYFLSYCTENRIISVCFKYAMHETINLSDGTPVCLIEWCWFVYHGHITHVQGSI